SRKMSMKISAWGSNGKIVADRQELQIYVRDTAGLPGDLRRGWNMRNTTDLTNEVWFYLRGEEYSAQVDHFFQAIKSGSTDTRSTFRSACDTDLLALALIENAKLRGTPVMVDTVSRKNSRPGFWSSLRRIGTQDSTATA